MKRQLPAERLPNEETGQDGKKILFHYNGEDPNDASNFLSCEDEELPMTLLSQDEFQALYKVPQGVEAWFLESSDEPGTFEAPIEGNNGKAVGGTTDESLIQFPNTENTIGARFVASPTDGNLETDIKLGWILVKETPLDHPDRLNRFDSLGLLFSEKYSRTGDHSDVVMAYHLAEEACNLTPEDDLRKTQRLGTLADVASQRYHATRNVYYLDEAVQFWRTAGEKMSLDHTDAMDFMNSVAAALGQKFLIAQETSCILTAVEISRRAIQTLMDAGKRATTLNVLSSNLHLQYLATGDVTHLNEGIDIIRCAIDEIEEDGDQHSGEHYFPLCKLLYESYHKTRNAADLEEAIRVGRAAYQLQIGRSLDEAVHLRILGDAVYAMHDLSGTKNDFDEATRCFEAALNHASSHVFDRVKAGQRLFQCFALGSQWDEAYDAACALVELFPSLSNRWLSESALLEFLAELDGLASDMAAVALNAGQEPFVALEFIEKGRNITTATFGETRTDISDLRQKEPELAAQLDGYRNQLDHPMSAPNVFDEPEFKHLFWQPYHIRRIQAIQKHDKLVDTIRTLPGFGDFFRVPREARMRSAAVHGPIVSVNVSEYRCDAILVQMDDIRALSLPNLTKSDVRKRAQTKSMRSLSVLVWLWDSLTMPVLDALGYTHCPGSQETWPHVWWITTGSLSRLPLHASGRLFTGSFDTVLDRVISSYSTSIRSLITTRSRPPNTQNDKKDNAVMIAMEHTPGQPALPFAREEVKIVSSICREMGLRPTMPGNQKDDILNEIGFGKILHFAGHGCTDPTNPSGSHLILEFNDFPISEKSQTNKLTVANIQGMNLMLTPPFLAYLSACGTSRVGLDRLADQTTIHLAGACQLAGFRHVIGTLWEVVDERCADVARITYSVIRDGGMTDESVCWGLHQASRELRDIWKSSVLPGVNDASNNIDGGITLPRDVYLSASDGEDEELERSPYWVPYIHFGP
ncbi:CHAT domain-containing protein [Xylariaceae sp. FL0255]|nr:CHAT domain-containing protein [Xylariaceae sp. FL0255]